MIHSIQIYLTKAVISSRLQRSLIQKGVTARCNCHCISFYSTNNLIMDVIRTTLNFKISAPKFSCRLPLHLNAILSVLHLKAR